MVPKKKPNVSSSSSQRPQPHCLAISWCSIVLGLAAILIIASSIVAVRIPSVPRHEGQEFAVGNTVKQEHDGVTVSTTTTTTTSTPETIMTVPTVPYLKLNLNSFHPSNQEEGESGDGVVGSDARPAVVEIQIASDLHTEFYGSSGDDIPDDIIIPQAPILALLGDVGLAGTESLQTFLFRQSERFEHVLVLTGNHEFYNPSYRGGGDSDEKMMTVDEQWAWMQGVCDQRSNLHLLERTVVEIEGSGVILLGTTLWSHIPDNVTSQAERSMNDYHLSVTSTFPTTQLLRAADTTAEFWKSVQWLNEQLEAYDTDQNDIVVLTHHTPSLVGTSKPQYDGSDLSHCFSSDLTALLEPQEEQSPPVKKNKIHTWACGHTHYNYDFVLQEGGTRVVSNQRGYPGREAKGYNQTGIVIRIPVA